MQYRIVQSGQVRHFTNDLARAARFARTYGGTVQRFVFGEWHTIH